ncbi:Nuclease-related domain-containing protein [Lachnospiraceae bacterium KHCPX20]|nr:Nuclease-related domain-containing protein [Lachnospiraceae bacterium KHCPX20]
MGKLVNIVMKVVDGVVDGVADAVTAVSDHKENVKKKQLLEERERKKDDNKEFLRLLNLLHTYTKLKPLSFSDIEIVCMDFKINVNQFDETKNEYYIEFFTNNNKKFYLTSSKSKSDDDIYNEKYYCPDRVEDVYDALSYIIPRYDCSRIKHIYHRGSIDYDFVNRSNLFEKLAESDLQLLIRITEAWQDESVLQTVGRKCYDKYLIKINAVYPCLKNKQESDERIAAMKQEKIDIEKRELERVQREKDEKLKEESIASAGKKGEEEVSYQLSWLEDSLYKVIQSQENEHIVIQNLEYRDESQEYDHIVVGPCGVILIETKAYSGEISIDSDGNWKRRKGGNDWIGVTNPVQQVVRHEKLIRSFIPKNVPIHSFICIANDRAIIEGGSNSLIPLVKSDQIVTRIESLKTDTSLTNTEVSECAKLIEQHMI